MIVYTALFLLSAGTLVFELALTRIFSVAQFYHFAFMAVSLALLGFGASGSLLAIFPGWIKGRVRSKMGWLALGCAGSMIGSYLVINTLPFDSYAIAWDGRQLAYLALYFLSLAVPFGFSGLAVGLLLAARPAEANRTYAVNLAGSAVGCLLLLPSLPLLGGEGTVVFSAWLALAAAVVVGIGGWKLDAQGAGNWRLEVGGWKSPSPVTHYPLLITLPALVLVTIWLIRPPAFLQLRLSPYKGLYQALLNPEAEHVSSQWNAFSRVDVVESPSVRSLPGLSFTYQGTFPRQVGIAVDGGNLMPITAVGEGMAWAEALPEALAYQLRPGARALILASGGGLAAATALANGAEQITVVENNPLLAQAVRDDYSSFTGGLYTDPRVSLHPAGPRAFVRQAGEQYTVIHLALTDPHRPVRSGAYSLGENYLFTVEAFAAYLERLDDNGLLVVTRWLQTPPSETVRLLALALEALEQTDIAEPAGRLVAYRSFQTGTLLVKRAPWTEEELAAVRAFCQRLRYDLIYYPGMPREEANQYMALSKPIYYETWAALAGAADREAVYRDSEFEIAPPTDDRPFFFHFFKWRQAPQVLRELGKSWQPFGGAGYFVLLVLLALGLVAAAVFILLPLALRPQSIRSEANAHPISLSPLPIFTYFGLLGLGFLFVEIPLIQQFILFVDHPTYSLVAVLFVVLLCSGAGSLTAKRWRPEWALGLLVAAVLLSPPLLKMLFQWALGWPLAARLALTLPGLAPLSFLMGVPFARGLALLESQPGGSALIPWAWAINGSASVVASILAALLAMSLGFQGVLWLGAGAYAGAWLVVGLSHRISPRRHGEHREKTEKLCVNSVLRSVCAKRLW